MLIIDGVVEDAKKKLQLIETLDMPLLNSDDYERTEFISQNISDISMPMQGKTQKFDLVKNFQVATDLLKIYEDRQIIQNIKKINTYEDKGVPVIARDTDSFSFLTRIELVEDEEKTYKGLVAKYTVPYQVDQFCGIYLAHEFNHALKETNIDEFILRLVSGEIIPLFFELLSIEKSSLDYKKNFLQYRIHMLNSSTEVYYEAKSRINEDEKVFDFIKTESGQYGNAFYYALILYNMYKKKPKQVLAEVRKVLLHKQTTVDMLNKLGIYGIKNERDIVTQELNKIYKLTK